MLCIFKYLCIFAKSKRIAAPLAVATSVTTFMNEWRSVQEAKTRTPSQTPVERWLPPAEGWLKANADGATSKMGDKGLKEEVEW